MFLLYNICARGAPHIYIPMFPICVNRIEYEFSVASHSIRILNGVEMFCWEVASSRGHRHKSGPESFVYLFK